LSKLAYLFPGQGSQAVGMGKALLQESPAARAVFEEADEALGEKLSRVILEGPEEELRRTANGQPAILTVSIAALRALEERTHGKPDFVAGHSLGEFSALVAAGAFSFADAVRVVRERGRFMQEAVPEGQGAMAAVMLMDAAEIHRIVEDVAAAGVYVAVANFNGPGQTVIAGHKAGVDRAIEALKAAGAKKVVPLAVSAPFHCALMSPVQPLLAEVLSRVEVKAPAVPVVSNVEALPNTDAGRVKGLLVEQVVAPVRFTEMAELLVAEGVDRFVELGAGKTLTGLMKRLAKGATFLNVEDPESLGATLKALAA
jgi:[acyl-carrier-protein] S-malonyltransferase